MLEGWVGWLLQNYMVYKYEILKEVKILYKYTKECLFLGRNEKTFQKKNVPWATQFLLNFGALNKKR